MVGVVNPDYKINITNATLFAKNATLNPSVQMAHIKALEKSTVKYPMQSVDCKVYSIPAGARSNAHENLFLGTLPKRLVLCCITHNEAYKGSYDKNLFHAKNNDINVLAVYVDGRQIPSKPLQLNFDDNLFIRSYMNLFSSTGKVWQDEGTDCLAATSGPATPSSVLTLPLTSAMAPVSIWYKRATRAATSSTTTEMDTLQIARLLAMDLRTRSIFRGVVPKDGQPMTVHALMVAFVCNTDEPGEHWIPLYLDADGCGDYFCLYGLPRRHAFRLDS